MNHHFLIFVFNMGLYMKPQHLIHLNPMKWLSKKSHSIGNDDRNVDKFLSTTKHVGRSHFVY